MRAALCFLALFTALAGFAYELDPYTYRNVPLRDSGAFLNQEFNRDVQALIAAVNAKLGRKAAEAEDAKVEFLFSSAYRASLGDIYANKWETCTLSNTCKGWPQIDRILVTPQESIYGEAQYNFVTTHFIVPSINACGVRMGSDKLAHMLILGFRLYNMAMDSRQSHTMQTLYDFSLEEERAFQGATVDEVISYADIEANLQGVRLFQDLLNRGKYLARDTATGQLRQTATIDLCSYLNPHFDEAILPNEYTGKRKAELFAAIARREEMNKYPLSDEQRQQLLARKATFSATSPALRAYIVARLMKDTLVGKDRVKKIRQLLATMIKVEEKHRRKSSFPRREE